MLIARPARRTSLSLSLVLWAFWSLACAAGIGDGTINSGEPCTPTDEAAEDECAWNGDNPGFCTEGGLCAMSCDGTIVEGSDGTSCLAGATCISERIGDVSWAYCLATCSNPTGAQEDCPSDQLKCVSIDDAAVCVTIDESIIY